MEKDNLYFMLKSLISGVPDAFQINMQDIVHHNRNLNLQRSVIKPDHNRIFENYVRLGPCLENLNRSAN